MWQRLYLDMTVERDITWAGEINERKTELVTFIVSVSFVSGTAFGTIIPALPRVNQALSVGFLGYILPSFNNPHKIDITTLLELQGRNLFTCLDWSAVFCVCHETDWWLPRFIYTSSSNKIYSAPSLGRLTEHRSHHLDIVLTERSSSPYGRTWARTRYQRNEVSLTQRDVRCRIPGIFK